MNLLSNFIKTYREKNFLSLRSFAELCDISHTVIRNIENNVDPKSGKEIRITNETIYKIAVATNVSPTYIFNLSLNIDSSDYLPNIEVCPNKTVKKNSIQIHNLEFSSNLKSIRKKLNYTQEDMSKLLGITKAAYGFYEQGRTIPDIETLVTISNIFEVSTDLLLGKKNTNINELLISDTNNKKQAIIELNTFIDFLNYKYK